MTNVIKSQLKMHLQTDKGIISPVQTFVESYFPFVLCLSYAFCIPALVHMYAPLHNENWMKGCGWVSVNPLQLLEKQLKTHG